VRGTIADAAFFRIAMLIAIALRIIWNTFAARLGIAGIVRTTYAIVANNWWMIRCATAMLLIAKVSCTRIMIVTQDSAITRTLRVTWMVCDVGCSRSCPNIQSFELTRIPRREVTNLDSFGNRRCNNSSDYQSFLHCEGAR
jgi:hypothetical protein